VSTTVPGDGPGANDRPSAEQWSRECQWHYELGLIEGYARGRADADAELVGALAEMLGGPGEDDYRKAVRRHHATLDALARRSRADQGAFAQRADYTGGPVDWHTGREQPPSRQERAA
jgi:hypothetical protein